MIRLQDHLISCETCHGRGRLDVTDYEGGAAFRSIVDCDECHGELVYEDQYQCPGCYECCVSCEGAACPSLAVVWDAALDSARCLDCGETWKLDRVELLAMRGLRVRRKFVYGEAAKEMRARLASYALPADSVRRVS